MKKLLLLAAAVLLVGILGLWWAIRAIPWDEILQLPESVETSLGDAYWESYAATATVVEGAHIGAEHGQKPPGLSARLFVCFLV